VSTLATTKMSSRGRSSSRKPSGTKWDSRRGRVCRPGAKRRVMLKGIKRPSMKEFDALIKQARRQAKAAGLTRTDVARPSPPSRPK